MPIRIFADSSHYRRDQRRDLNDIVKAQWNDRGAEERRAVYGRIPELFTMVDRPEDAELCVLPMRWNWYVDSGRLELAHQAVQAARRAGKIMVAFSLGDFTANLPWRDVHLFECSTYRSRAGKTVHAMPPFFGDAATARYDGQPPIRKWIGRPAVGFCGQAGGSRLEFAKRRLSNLGRRIGYRLGRTRWEPTPFEHTALRQRVLGVFSSSRAVESDFIIRDQYRAGLELATQDDAARARSEQEFYDNLLGCDYTVCVRGGGNYTKRFYESLCVGRIPIQIDTDNLLPFSDVVDWSRFCVFIPLADLDRAPEIVADFHARFTPEAYAERQHECRRLWQERLTPDGFYAHFHEHFASFAGR